MTSLALNQARNRALTLSEAERAELAHGLVASLDGIANEAVTDAIRSRNPATATAY